jgi:hypothetical protein
MTEAAAQPKGAFQLSRPIDLYDKLERELLKIHADPLDTDAAFNFFITAWHLLDWVLPGDDNKERRDQLRASTPILSVVSSLANGAKHLVVRAHVDSVKNPHLIAERAPIPGARNNRFLAVQVSDALAKEFGANEIYAINLAYKARLFWHEYFATNGLLMR